MFRDKPVGSSTKLYDAVPTSSGQVIHCELVSFSALRPDLHDAEIRSAIERLAARGRVISLTTTPIAVARSSDSNCYAVLEILITTITE